MLSKNNKEIPPDNKRKGTKKNCPHLSEPASMILPSHDRSARLPMVKTYSPSPHSSSFSLMRLTTP